MIAVNHTIMQLNINDQLIERTNKFKYLSPIPSGIAMKNLK